MNTRQPSPTKAAPTLSMTPSSRPPMSVPLTLPTPPSTTTANPVTRYVVPVVGANENASPTRAPPIAAEPGREGVGRRVHAPDVHAHDLGGDGVLGAGSQPAPEVGARDDQVRQGEQDDGDGERDDVDDRHLDAEHRHVRLRIGRVERARVGGERLDEDVLKDDRDPEGDEQGRLGAPAHHRAQTRSAGADRRAPPRRPPRRACR